MGHDKIQVPRSHPDLLCGDMGRWSQGICILQSSSGDEKMRPSPLHSGSYSNFSFYFRDFIGTHITHITPNLLNPGFCPKLHIFNTKLPANYHHQDIIMTQSTRTKIISPPSKEAPSGLCSFHPQQPSRFQNSSTPQSFSCFAHKTTQSHL